MTASVDVLVGLFDRLLTREVSTTPPGAVVGDRTHATGSVEPANRTGSARRKIVIMRISANPADDLQDDDVPLSKINGSPILLDIDPANPMPTRWNIAIVPLNTATQYRPECDRARADGSKSRDG
jgi:hypothetical protein